jgi:uncharacterized protein (TIGR02246 family)
MKRLKFSCVLLVSASLLVSDCATAQDQAKEEVAIRQAVENYVVAFNRQDAKALAAFWSPEATYVYPLTGMELNGREAIEQHFASIFADGTSAKLEATTESVQFISPGVAVEHGSAKLFREGQGPEEATYTAIYVKRDGQWLLDRLTDTDPEELVASPSHYEKLKALEWLVGNWRDEDEQATVVTECHWAKNNNFLVRSFTVQVEDRIDMAGMQVIGWDPSTNMIRSWVFDSDGGFGQGTWTNKGDRWFVQQSGVLADGRKSSAVNIITRVDENTCTLQSVNRTEDGELLPNIEEVQIKKE